MPTKLLATALLLIPLSPTLPAEVGEPLTFADLHVARILEETGGSLPGKVHRTTFERLGDGEVLLVEREIALGEHLRSLSELPIPAAEPALAEPRNGGTGTRSAAAALGRGCAPVTLAVLQAARGTTPPEPLAAFVEEPRNPGRAVPMGCYGAPLLLADVTFDSARAGPGRQVATAAAAQVWTENPAGSGTRQGWFAGSGHGFGTYHVDTLCFSGYCFTLEQLILTEGAVLVGPSALRS